MTHVSECVHIILFFGYLSSTWFLVIGRVSQDSYDETQFSIIRMIFFFGLFLQTRNSLSLAMSRTIRMMKHISVDICIYIWVFFKFFFCRHVIPCHWPCLAGFVPACGLAWWFVGGTDGKSVCLCILFSEFFQVRIYHFIYFIIYHLLAVLIVGVCFCSVCVWMYFGAYVCSSVSVCLYVCVCMHTDMRYSCVFVRVCECECVHVRDTGS